MGFFGHYGVSYIQLHHLGLISHLRWGGELRFCRCNSNSSLEDMKGGKRSCLPLLTGQCQDYKEMVNNSQRVKTFERVGQLLLKTVKRYIDKNDQR